MLPFESLDRLWTFQACSEFGFFETTDAGAWQPFGAYLPIDYFTKICVDLFGGEFDNIEARIEATNQWSGGASPNGLSKVLFVNGIHNPWKELFVQQAKDHQKAGESRVFLLPIEASPVGADLYSDIDDDHMKLTRQLTKLIIELFLLE